MAVKPDVPVQFSAGVNNRTDETKLPTTAARQIVNLDLNAGGTLSARHGRTQVHAGVGIHSLWSCDAIDFALYVQADTLYLMGAAGEHIALREGLQPRDMSYTFVNSRVFYSNGVDTGCVTTMGTVLSWGVEVPRALFTATPTAGGGLAAGEYLVAITYVAGQEESGARGALAVTIPDNGGIALDALPAPLTADPTALRVYVSNANDPRLFHVRDVAIGMASVTIGAGGRGRPLDTQFLAQAPAGRYLLVQNARIFSALGRLLRWTQPVRYGLYDPANNYLTVPKPITGLAAPDTPGLVLYVGTANKTYLFQGDDIATATLVAAAHTGMVPGSVVQVSHEALGLEGINYPCPVWLGSNGTFFVGTTQGILPLNKNVVSHVYGKVASAFVERDGASRMIMAGAGTKKSVLAFSDAAVAHVIDIGSGS